MKISEILIETSNSGVTLEQIYDGDYPDRDEMFWDYVTPGDLNKMLTVEIISPMALQNILLNQYRVEHIDEILEMLDGDDDRNDLVNQYKQGSSKPIIISNNRVIDGNHRALGAVLANKAIQFVDLAELD